MKNNMTHNQSNLELCSVGVRRLVRKLEDRVEQYESETEGICGNCGEPVIRVNGSNATANRDKARYRYPEDLTTAWNIYRCKYCTEVISDTFEVI